VSRRARGLSGMIRAGEAIVLRLLAAVLAAACVVACGQSRGTEDGQWRSYGGDPGGTRYTALDQVDASNFTKLAVAWTWEPPDRGWRESLLERRKRGEVFPGVQGDTVLAGFQVTPLMVDGVLYGITPTSRVFALDAGTGAQRWEYDPRAYDSTTTAAAFIAPKNRGVSYWRSGDDERIIVPTYDAYLLALDARTGKPIESFGSGGRVDLLAGLRREGIRRVDDYFQSSPAAVVGDTVVVGGSITDMPQRDRQVPGDIRAYDVRTGALRWTFLVVPPEGGEGVETWENESWRDAGSANAWAPMSVDPDLGFVYVVTSSASNDFYGGHRVGDNLYADTLLCLEAATGRKVWHQQLIRHGLWDYDPAAPPNLVDIDVDGRAIRAVVEVTKQGFAFVFDRVTGEPVWPIEDRPVPASDVPGERAAPTQRFPTRPPPFERQGTSEDDLADFTPSIRARALEVFRRYRSGPLFTPPSLEGTLTLPGQNGGTGWRGAGFDPESHVLFVPSITNGMVTAVQPGTASPHWKQGTPAYDYVMQFLAPLTVPGTGHRHGGLPLFKPPYSRITAIDLDQGATRWQVPNGNGPRDHPALRGLDLPPLGSGVHTCPLVTKTLLIAADGGDYMFQGHGEPLLRAFDKTTGAVVGEVPLPARVQGCPMSYLHEGRQYVAVATADENHPPVLVALALPRTSPTGP